MQQLATTTKVLYFIQKSLLKNLPELMGHLLDGDLLSFERHLRELLDNLYNYISELMLKEAAEQVQERLLDQANVQQLKKIQHRSLNIQIASGHIIKVPSLYACKISRSYTGARHLLASYWTIISNASPGYIDKVCMSSALCPSYEVVNQFLTHFGIKQGTSRVRKLTNDVAFHCKDWEVKLTLKENENVDAKRVVIGIDGGRTRTRLYDGQTNQNGNATYQTPWCEPKMFVIDIIKQDGQLDRHRHPIYGCRFEEQDVLNLLEQYLRALGIEKCNQVQILGDGAPWIWNNIKNMLLSLGVAENKIVETLDYYHAVGYVNSLIEHLPLKYGKSKRQELLTQFKKWLWNGQSDKIVQKCDELYKRPSDLVKRWLNYLNKHVDKGYPSKVEK